MGNLTKHWQILVVSCLYHPLPTQHWLKLGSWQAVVAIILRLRSEKLLICDKWVDREKNKSKPSSSTLPDLCLTLRCKNSRKSGKVNPVKEQQNRMWCICKILLIKVLYRSEKSKLSYRAPRIKRKNRPCWTNWGAQKGDALGGAKHYFWIIQKFTCERKKLLKIVFIVQWCPVAGGRLLKI